MPRARARDGSHPGVESERNPGRRRTSGFETDSDRARSDRGGAGHHPRASRLARATTQVKILVPGDQSMVALLGQRDELLKLVEGAFDSEIVVRGNEITIAGPDVEVEDEDDF